MKVHPRAHFFPPLEIRKSHGKVLIFWCWRGEYGVAGLMRWVMVRGEGLGVRGEE